MPSFVKVCEIDEVLPGKGKRVHVAGRELLVYNREGRVFAALEDHLARGAQGAQGAEPPPGEAPASCHHPGAHIEVEQTDSPARARAHTAFVQVLVREDGVYVVLEEAGGVATSP